MPELDTPWEAIGRRIRDARTAAGLSVREVARRVGVSPSHISQVERGVGAFSVPVLYSVSRELDVSVHDLLEPGAARPRTVAGRAQTHLVQRAKSRAVIQLDSGPRWSRLTPRGEPDAEFLELAFAPSTPAPEQVITHEGREYGVVVAGELTVEVDGSAHLLRPGDSIVFDSTRPHRFWNDSADEVRAIWFVRDRGPGEIAPHG